MTFTIDLMQTFALIDIAFWLRIAVNHLPKKTDDIAVFIAMFIFWALFPLLFLMGYR